MSLARPFASTDAIIIVAIVALLLLSMVLVMAYEALSRMNLLRAQTISDDEPRQAEVLEHIVREPESVINPLRLLVLVVQLAEATLVAVLVNQLFSWPLALGIMVANVCLVFVVAEAVPRTIGITRTDRVALATARPMMRLTTFAPIRLVARALISLTNLIVPGKGLHAGPFASTQDLLALVDAAVEEDVMEPEERDLIESVIEFSDTVVREVMVPRTDMQTVSVDATVEDSLEQASQAGFSRMPVVGDDNDDVVGLVYVKDLIRAELDGFPDEPIRSQIRTAQFVPETKRVAELLAEMQRQSFHMAMAVDEYGGIAGLVTMEDLIEELVGEIVDEYDQEEPLVEQVGRDYRVDGRIPVDELNDLANLDLPEGDWDTVAGLLFDQFGRVPSVHDAWEFNGHRLVIERLQGRRIIRVLVQPAAGSEEPADSAGDTE